MAFSCFFVIQTGLAQKINEPDLENFSKANIQLIEPLIPGTKMLFRQNCIPGFHETLPSGIVRFRNLMINKDAVNVLVEFKDTVVKKLIFTFKLNDADAITYFQISLDHFIRIDKKEAFQSYCNGNLEYTCFLKRKKITLISSYKD